MSTISLRVSEKDATLIKEYSRIHGLSISSFIRDLVIEKIEDELKIDEQRILDALQKSYTEETFTLDKL